MARPHIELEINQAGFGSIKLDGVEMPYVQGVTVTTSAGEVTEVAIRFVPAHVAIKAKSARLTDEAIDAMAQIVEAYRTAKDAVEIKHSGSRYREVVEP